MRPYISAPPVANNCIFGLYSPVNAMGTSKAMMEKVIVAKSRTVDPNKTKICCTRYGNVMCSRGSVIPLWIEQIRQGKPITILIISLLVLL